MKTIIPAKRPVSVSVICFLCLMSIVVTVLLFLRLYNRTSYASELERKWCLVMIGLQLPVIAGVLLMYFLKKIGLWLFLIGKVLFFALPLLAGVDVLGLMTPVYMLESATFFILFGSRIKYMK